MITFKETVRIKVLSPATYWLLECLYKLDQNRPLCAPDLLVITSANDGSHMPGSRHFSDEAIDIRSKNFPDPLCKMTFVQLYQNMLNSHPHLPGRFTVLFEDKDTPNEHFHAQVKKGMIFDWV